MQYRVEFVLEDDPTLSQLRLVGFARRLDAALMSVDMAVDVMILVGKTRKMRVRRLDFMNLVDRFGKFCGKFVRRVSRFRLS